MFFIFQIVLEVHKILYIKGYLSYNLNQIENRVLSRDVLNW